MIPLALTRYILLTTGMLPHSQEKTWNKKTSIALERAYKEFHSHFELLKDPLQFPRSFRNPLDQEASAFISSCLSYGNANLICRFLKQFHELLGDSPYSLLASNRELPILTHLKYRFTVGYDLLIVLFWLRHIYQTDGSIENFFNAGPDLEPTHKICDFVNRLRNLPLPTQLEQWKNARLSKIQFLVPSPQQGSSCKRLMMFLRWVVRPNDGLDLGLWKKVSPSTLILPLDTHTFKVVRDLGWVRTSSPSWKAAITATQHLKLYYPEDPLKYDFALCHMGMNKERILQWL